jgi:type IV fimbrial biogenesis protein FimT
MLKMSVIRNAREPGFSLIELLVVLAIAAISLAMGVPSFRILIQNQRTTTTVNDFFAAVNLARSEAMQRGVRVDLMPAQGGNDWTKGWVVFVDRNGNHKPDSSDQIIFTHGPVPEGLKIESKLKDSSAEYLAYNGYGRTRVNASPQVPQSGNVSFTSDQLVRKVIINFLGRARVCDPVKEPTTC